MTTGAEVDFWGAGLAGLATNYFGPHGNDLSPVPENGNKIATSFAAQMSHIVAQRDGRRW